MGIFDNLKPAEHVPVDRLTGGVKKSKPTALDMLKKQRRAPEREVPVIELRDLDKIIEPDKMLSAEIRRIVNLPVNQGMTEEEVRAFSAMTVNAEYYQKGFRLLKPQAEALMAYQMIDGAFLPVGVGCGKTGISLMIPEAAYQKGLKKMLLIIPPNVLEQLTKYDIQFWRRRVSISYPIHVLGGRSKAARMKLAKSKRPGLYIITYSLLSTADTSEVLDLIDPDIIIADEAHNLASYNSARGKRIRHLLDSRDREFIPMSGTITNKSIQDYWHLARYAMKQNNFLPNSMTMAKDWGMMIDAEATKDDRDTRSWKPGVMAPLMEWAHANKESGDVIRRGVSGFRKAYSVRMSKTLGVVTTGDDIVKCSLGFNNRKIDYEKVEGWDRVEHFGKMIDEAWTTPNGDEIEHAMQTWKWKYQIYGGGFYTELIWPDTEEVQCKIKASSYKEADDFLDRAKQFHAAHQEYYKDLRQWLGNHGRPGLDTPKLVGSNMYHHKDRDVGSHLYTSWNSWRNTDFDDRERIVNPSKTDMYGRKKNSVRLCPFKILDMIEWIKSDVPDDEGCLIWVHNVEVGAWALQMMLEAGIKRVKYCPAGDQHNSEIINPEFGKHRIIASISAHGEGKNLQHFRHQYMLQHTRPAKRMEQLLGRCHRTGQKADELFVQTANCTLFDDITMAATLNDALYIHQTTNTFQKMIIANYSPVPKIFPSEVIREKTGSGHILTSEQRKLLKEKFGG